MEKQEIYPVIPMYDPWKARSLLSSVYYPAPSHGVICHIDEGITSMCTMCSSLRTVQTARHTAKEAMGSYVTGWSPYGGAPH